MMQQFNGSAVESGDLSQPGVTQKYRLVREKPQPPAAAAAAISLAVCSSSMSVHNWCREN